MENTHFEKGQTLFAQEKYTESIHSLDVILKSQPYHVPSLHLRALAYFKLRQFPAAIRDFDEALSLDSENAMIYSDRGVALHLAGNNQAALKDMNMAQHLEPDNPYRYSSRAYIKAAMGDTEGGIEDYQKAIQLDPDDAIAYNNLGMLEERLGYTQRAKQNFDSADKLSGREPEGYKDTSATQQQASDLGGRQEPASYDRPANPKPGAKDYLREMQKILSTAAGRKELIDFIRNKFKK
jgi:tetratricopeptide (TPR) repeat protein